jgi:dolichol-phosphate mannosyltransferase
MIIIVLPAYNEQDSIRLVLAKIRELQVKKNMDIQTIIVDDGSVDGTIENARLEMPEVRIVSHVVNKGLGEAIRTGIVTAVNVSQPGDVIVTMDADDTHLPALISKMVDRLDEGCDVVIASRYQPGARVVGVPFIRQVLSLGASWLFRIAYPVEGVKDYTCGYRAYRASVLRSSMEKWGDNFVTQSGFSVMVDILLKLSKMNIVFSEVPIILRYDQKPGLSKMNIKKTVLQTLVLLLKYRFGMY